MRSVERGLRVVTLTTDFGQGMYVAAMKGGLLRGCPVAVVVDISHDIPPQDVRAGAFVLRATAPYFPPSTVHIAVVDPGVGTGRKGLVIETRRGALVGPDNGLLIPAARVLGLRKVFEIDGERFPGASATFHGRDIFAPVAGALASGAAAASVGRPAREFVHLALEKFRRDGGAVEGEVLYIDRFGNAITTIPAGALEGRLKTGDTLRINGVDALFARTYGDAGGTPILLESSTGFMEVALRGGSASDRLGLRHGAAVRIEKC